MAREKVFKVVIDGEEYVSAAAKEAGDGMDRFTKKKDGWIKSFVDIRAAFDTVVQVGRALAGVAMESLAAFDEYSASMRRLEGTAKITGTPLETLTELAGSAKREFGLSTVQANSYATAVNNLATKAGYAGDKQELLAAMLDLGAAKGLTAAESLVAFEQSILGIDEGTDKLFGKNPSGLWADYAEQIGKAPGKMSDLDKSLVLVYATMEAGGKVQGSYSEWLQSSAGQTMLLTNRLQDAKVAFGEMLSPVRAVVVEGMNQFLDSLGNGDRALAQMKDALVLMAKNGVGVLLSAWQTFGPAVTFILKATVAGVMFFGDAIRALVIVVQKGVGDMIDDIGFLVQKGGKVLEVFGVKMVSDWGDTMRAWGQRTMRAADDSWGAFRRDSEAAWASVTSDAVAGTRRSAQGFDELGAVATKTGTTVATATAQAGDAIKRNLGPATRDLVKLTELAMVDLKATATETLSPKKADDFKGAMDVLTRKLHEARDATASMAPKVDENIDKTRDLTREVGTVARGALDLAQSFGVVDAEAASLLNSVVNIASALPRALAGDITSIGGIIGGVANIAAQITQGDQARRKLLSDNTRSLDRLSKEVSGLRLNVTGETFAKVQDVLSKVVPNLKLGGLQNFAGDMSTLATALRGSGLTMADLEAVAKELGIGLRDGSGNFRREALGQLLQAMGLVTPTTMGSSFADQRALMEDRFGVQGTSATQQLADLFGLGTRFGVGALGRAFDPNDLSTTRASLGALFEQFAAGGLSASDLGGLTSSEFRDLLLDLIKRTDDLLGGGASTPTPAPAPVAGGETLPPVGSAPTPASTLADVFRDYASETLPLFTQQIALQTRIADATEATAANTALTAEEVRALREAIASEAFINGIDRALADRRRDAEITTGQGIRL